MPQGLRSKDLVDSSRGKPAPRIDAKFVPVCFSRMPDEALSGLSLHMRSVDSTGKEKFTLYASAGVKFTALQRERLEKLGITFIYIPAEDQPKLRRQLEEKIETLADDSAIEMAVRCEIIYESGLELIDEALTTRNLADGVPRMRRLARSIVTLYLESTRAFTHFYTAARHDMYASTHAINAGVWLPALAMALGEMQREQLTKLCTGALLYDIGMAFVPQAILKNQSKLNAGEKQQIQQHPEMGAQMLRQLPEMEPEISIMALQHQERLDGSGYPRKLTYDQIHQAARLAAVIDTFDALTSFRPYRQEGISPAAAVAMLKRETPHRYDPSVVAAWSQLMESAFPEMMETGKTKEAPADGALGKRRFARYSTNFSATLRTLSLVGGIWTEKASINAVAHNLSRGGLGLLLRTKLKPGEYFKARLQAKDGVKRTLTGIVVRVRERADGLFEAGARFVDLAQEPAPLPDGEFLSPEAPGGVQEKSAADGADPMMDGEFVAPG